MLMKGKKILVISLIATSLIAISSTAYAGTAPKSKQSPKVKITIKDASNKKNTQNIKKDAAKKKNDQENKRSKSTKKTINPFGKLVSSGTITQAQADAILAAVKSSNGDIKSALDKLVSSNTIIQAQEDAVIKLFPQRGKEAIIKNVLNNLISDVKITQDQSDLIISALLNALKSHKS